MELSPSIAKRPRRGTKPQNRLCYGCLRLEHRRAIPKCTKFMDFTMCGWEQTPDPVLCKARVYPFGGNISDDDIYRVTENIRCFH